MSLGSGIQDPRSGKNLFGILTYLLLVAMSPFLHVEGSRTRLGAVVVGRYCSVWYILVSIVAFHLRMGNCSFFNAC
jgi:hypothetical protein